jgi:hypothetical protein
MGPNVPRLQYCQAEEEQKLLANPPTFEGRPQTNGKYMMYNVSYSSEKSDDDVEEITKREGGFAHRQGGFTNREAKHFCGPEFFMQLVKDAVTSHSSVEAMKKSIARWTSDVYSLFAELCDAYKRSRYAPATPRIALTRDYSSLPSTAALWVRLHPETENCVKLRAIVAKILSMHMVALYTANLAVDTAKIRRNM